MMKYYVEICEDITVDLKQNMLLKKILKCLHKVIIRGHCTKGYITLSGGIRKRTLERWVERVVHEGWV